METKLQILRRRKEIEQELVDLLKETRSDFGLENIKEIIYWNTKKCNLDFRVIYGLE